MLKKIIILCIVLLSFNTVVQARTNSEIARHLYTNARKIEEKSPAKADYARDAIASFMLDINMLNFNENYAQWKPLSNGYYYDAKSMYKMNNRYLGVYKNTSGSIMGSFDVNCEDYNDMQERMYGFVETTEVYFTTDFKLRNGHSKGLAQKFCK